MPASLLTLPIELVYRILDNLNNKTIFLSLSSVCTRLNTIINTYHPYQVNSSFITKLAFHHLRNIVYFKKESYSTVLSCIQFSVKSNMKIIFYCIRS